MQRARGEKACMFAAAIVMQLGVCLAGGRQRSGCRVDHRLMTAAAQMMLVAARLVQHRVHCLGMHRLAGMAGAQQRHFLLREAEFGWAVRVQERQGLKRLKGRSGEGQKIRVPCLIEQIALHVDDRDRAEMNRFDISASRDFN